MIHYRKTNVEHAVQLVQVVQEDLQLKVQEPIMIIVSPLLFSPAFISHNSAEESNSSASFE
jgi:hypothetical protein